MRAERSPWRRAYPRFGVDAGRHRAVLLVADVIAKLDVEGLGHQHLFDLSGLGAFDTANLDC
ncbi:MAG: hypothetical protein FJW30_21085 [Acidobacteria bacterium]|nr:hypothetical protein [Acidobacteriota bacterium]